uniref:Caspase n=1 Tax=Rhipicephalus zambeziensis TaxID=60191 RepID=A0A224YTZ3_9ACAR
MAGMGGDDLPALDKKASNNSESDARNIYGGIYGTQSMSPPRVLPTSLEAEEYNMSHLRRGKCVIFNYKRFGLHTKLKERKGTDLDANNLQSCFRGLGFETVTYNDLSCKDTKDKLEILGKQDYSNDDCFVCCFLTHGNSNILYGSDGKFPVDTVMEPFHSDVCPSLLGKPKLFFIQACRGDRIDSGTKAVLDTADSPTRIYCIHTQADILTAYCSVPGFCSWHNKKQGSWFIEALCLVLRERAHSSDLLSMLTVVCRRVALDYETYKPMKPKRHHKKQVPFISSTLTRLVFFREKLEAASF